MTRDKTRINSFLSQQESIHQVNGEKNETNTHPENDTDSDMANEENNKRQELDLDQNVEDHTDNDSECTSTNDHQTKEESCTEINENDDKEVVKNEHMTEKNNECETHINATQDSEQAQAQDDTVKNTVKSKVDIVHQTKNEMEDPEAVYRKNIRNKQRNLTFGKIVHDTRNEGSIVYGMTDDLIRERSLFMAGGVGWRILFFRGNKTNDPPSFSRNKICDPPSFSRNKIRDPPIFFQNKIGDPPLCTGFC